MFKNSSPWKCKSRDKEVNAKNYGPTMHGFTPVSTILWKMVRFFIINIYYIFNSSKKKLSRLKSGNWFGQIILNASSKENGTGQYPVWMTQKPRKGDFRGLKSHKFLEGACHWTPLARSLHLVQETSQYLFKFFLDLCLHTNLFTLYE